MKNYMFLILLSLSAYSSDLVLEFNDIIKNDKNNEVLILEYNKYVFEKEKEILKFFRVNKAYKQLNEYYNKLSYENKERFIEFIIDDSKIYVEMIKEIDLFGKIFIPSKLEREQDLQFHIYNLLIDNRLAYYNIIQYSNQNNHFSSIFNPNVLIKLSNRYKYFVLMFSNKGFMLSYPNMIDYLLSPEYVIKEIQEYGLDDNYKASFEHYSKINTIVKIPFSVKTILLDRMNQQKTIEINLNLNFESKLSDFMKNIENINFYAKHSHELLLEYLKDSNDTRLKEISHQKQIDEFENFTEIDFSYLIKTENLLKYMKDINLILNHVNISEDLLIQIKVNDKYDSKIYDDIKLFLNENSIEYLY